MKSNYNPMQHVRLIGSYSDSRGISVIRKDVEEFITKRDGGIIPANYENIYLTNGATDGIRVSMTVVVGNKLV